ncbi:HlyD family secretion protein [Martelella endophytica]|uniref:Multidrug transporter n=1 Tax=Martelella endophytica TaxID=1486262 RepID=A0A0D5LLE4_MAREN|nr:HlyD family efflux transporter periplasmic adaptor subunit [Martelella endophytica]AJY44587.1 hypothetical protein TM49_01080 [Martelella endophytica]
MKRLAALVVVLALAIAAGFIFLRHDDDQGWLGWVEADMVYVGATSTARLTELTVSEGDIATKDATLFSLQADSEKAAVDTASANLKKAEAALSLARAPMDREQELEALEASRAEAQAAFDYAQKALTRAQALVKQQSGTEANLDDAVSNYAQAKAALDKINAQIALGKLPQRDQQISQAEQQVAAAEGDLANARATLALKTVTSPATGKVQQVYYRVGEVAPAGRPVISLLPPENVNIEFFVPEQSRAGIATGDRISFTCDGCEAGEATVSFIAEDAEYTPPEIFSREERAKMVYRVRARPSDPATLPVGLPVEVTLGSRP